MEQIHGKTKRQRQREAAAYQAARWILTALLAGVLLVLLVGPAKGEEAGEDEQMQKLAVLAAYAVIDYHQSAGWVTPGGGAEELNPVLGEHPSRGGLAAFGIIGVGAVYALSEVLPEPWARIVVDSALASEQFNIEENRRAELGQKRRIEAIPVIVSVRW